ncbi:hypothetical protein A7985_15435 [Pseudoalteromonas luteoviolacea]|uniref:Zinc ribbon-containing protein n=1 Tax=Pseudoalteromonas luteoviolacea TaxID=43657 RepID=A0A1C0TP08_9GAMM|nr:hypothetical protein [Pseudoalteromonas luteoviolacea]MBQ4813025.1 hypothetical protein [Pseudoalteromonas luteoviolacea]OCQ20450.1 hypothetical protein A7985_15435 [Pseudoalteromonas luteoviolacea]
MADYKQWLSDFSTWMKDIKEHELKKLVENFIQEEEKWKEFGQNKINDYRHYFKRDLEHINVHHDHYEGVAWEEFKASILYELAYLEDRTQLEWQALMSDFEHDGVYKQGEWIALGQLVCKNCGNKIDIYHAIEITACSECGHDSFNRKALTP